jgi:RNA polymerase sigma-19 factor, ECF subfamily
MATSDSVPKPHEPRSESAISVFLRYAGKLHSYLGRRLGVREDAEDLAQDVYLELLRLNPSKEIRDPLAFLYGVASRILADHVSNLRRRAERLAPAGEMSEMAPDFLSHSLPDFLEESADAQRRVEHALAALPPMQAAIVKCVNCEGMTYEEAADQLGISVHTVKKYLVKAHARIRMEARAWK